MSLGENTRKRRIKLNLSQQELADALGYKTRSSITKLEKNKSGLTPVKIVTLSRILKTTADYLINGTDDEKSEYHGTLIALDNLQIADNRQQKRKKKYCRYIGRGEKKSQQVQYPFPVCYC